MNARVKYLICGVVFLISVGLGFLLTRYARTNVAEDELSETDSVAVNDTVPLVGEGLEVPQIDQFEIATVEVQKTGYNYSLKIVCKNVPDNIVLEYEIPELGMKSSDGFFSKVPGSKSESYEVIVIDKSNNEVLASKVVDGFRLIEAESVERMSSGMFQSLLLNQNDNTLLGGKHPQVAKTVTLSFEGLRDGEKRPGDILAVREKIAYGIWTSAKVLTVGYNDNGKINYAKIQPVY